MEIWQAVVLALVQAFTEFLPISSSAHLILARWLFGWRDPGLAFDVALHFGTLLALTAYFGRTWVRLLGLAADREVLVPSGDHPDKDLYSNRWLPWYLAAATLPAGLVGVLLSPVIEAHLRGPELSACMLIVVGGLIWWADRKASANHGDLGKLDFPNAMLIGCAQVLALVPGTSRSGITIAAALLLGQKRQAAARFSFLLAMPVVLGASLQAGMLLLAGKAGGGIGWEPLAAGVVVSAVAGYAVIAGFLRYLQRATLAPFAYYRVAFGIIILVLASTSGP